RRTKKDRTRSGQDNHGSAMKLIATATIAVAGAAVLLAQTGPTTRPQTPVATASAVREAQARLRAASKDAPPRSQTAPTATADAGTYRAFVDKYCVGCHNSRNAQPASDPLNLEKASLDDVLPSAATWERVLNKLSVRAMPPQNMPRPQEAEYAAFTTWLANSLDQAWAARGTAPGRYVVHRLNRTEYGNALRDLLAIDVDVTSLLPSDGGEFGFDNIATSLKTSPLLLERYVTAAQRISTLAVGDPKQVPGTTEYTINREVSQNGYMEGLPLGTRGGTVV